MRLRQRRFDVITPIIIFFIGVPLAAIAFTAKLAGFRAFYVLAASVIGEFLGQLLFAVYTTLAANAIRTGKMAGAVLYFPPAAPQERLKGIVLAIVVFICLGFAIGGTVLLGRLIYVRAKSA